MRQKKAIRGPRRGATLVFVAVLIIAFVGMAAFAVDLSRFHVGASELRTSSDAAALRGALQLQRVPGVSPADSVRRFSFQTNRALNDSVRIANADVVPVFWNDTTANYAVGWDLANAVEVRARQTSGLIFGRLLGATGLTPERRSIAWIANLRGLTCDFNPWGFPIQNIFDDLTALPNGNFLSQEQIAEMRALLQTSAGRARLTQIMYPAGESPVPQPSTSNYWPLASNMNDYADQIARNGGCVANGDVIVGGTEQSAPSFPGNGNGAPPKKAVDGVLAHPPAQGDELCAFRNSPNDATCLDPITGVEGVTVFAAFTGPPTVVGCTAGCNLPVRMIAGFRLVCVFRGNHPATTNRPQERCPWLQSSAFSSMSPSPDRSYPQGTLVGYPTLDVVSLGPGTQLGTTLSTAQRLILVR
jgi:hypothetical protein